MIVRNLCARQSRQLLAFNRQARNLNRFYTTETPTETPTQSTMQAHPEFETASGTISRTSLNENSGPEVPQAVKNAARSALGRREHQKSKFHQLGSTVKGAYHPEDIIDNPPKPSDITLELLLASQTHLGHSTSRWNPQNSRYIFGVREGVHIISLDVTAAYLRRAARVVEEVAARGGLVLFVGTRKGQKRFVVNAAERAQGYHIFERWIPGALTNGQRILGHCEKVVVNAKDVELPEFNEQLPERPALKPDLVICLNPLENVVLLHECGLNNVPTIGLIDTDANPTSVTYPIPCNDDSLRATGLIAGILGRAGQAGQKRRLAAAASGQLTHKPVDIKHYMGLEEEENSGDKKENQQ